MSLPYQQHQALATPVSWEGRFASQLGALMLLMLPAGLRQALGQGPSSSWLTPGHSCISQTCAPPYNQYDLAWAIWGSSDIFVLSSRLFVFWQLPRMVKCILDQDHTVCWCQSYVQGLYYKSELAHWLFCLWLLWCSGLDTQWLSGQMSWSHWIQLDNKLSATEK